MLLRSWPPGNDLNRLVPPEDVRPAIALTNIRVAIWTAGLKHVGAAAGGLSLNCLSCVGRRELMFYAGLADTKHISPATPDLFKRSLIGSGVLANADDVFYEIDARPFHDPGRVRGRINHLGMSGPVMHGVTKDKTLGRWFFDHVLAILAAARDLRGSGRLHVVSFCRAGWHRSVAVASLLELLLTRFTRWTVHTEHLAAHK